MPRADAILVPGVPSAAVPEREEAVYPSSAPDIRKLLLEGGVDAVWLDDRPRGYLDLKAAEDWLPILVFTQDALANGLGGVLTAAFLHYVDRARTARTKLHLKVGRIRRKDEEIEWLEADGDADGVLEALGKFLDED
jgi:hypothetical protein